VEAAIAKARPDVVVNAVGVIKQLAAAKDPIESITINSLLPHKLHRAAGAAGARLLHLSTDCVFSGKRGPSSERDAPDPVDLYGRSKWLGEVDGPGALTLRSSIIGREIASQSGLVEWFLAQRGKRVKGFRRAIYSGFSTLAMARVFAKVIAQHPQLDGVIQVASAPIDKFRLLGLVRDAFRVDVAIDPDDAVAIDRSLDGSAFAAATGFAAPSWEDMVAEMAADPTPYDAWRATP